MVDLMGPETEENPQEEARASEPCNTDGSDAPKRKISLLCNNKNGTDEKRPKRDDSSLGKKESRKLHKNELMGQLILKAKGIFDYVIDDHQKDDATLSSIISDCVRFETAWAKCPNAISTVRSFAADKLSPMYTTGIIWRNEQM